MLNLSRKELPNAIEVDGNSFLLNTDFRLWIKFWQMIQEEHTWEDYYFLFQNAHPVGMFLNQLLSFYLNPNSTPNVESDDEEDAERTVDYIEDGEFIYASFMQAYNIDLMDVDMHWHKFLALFRGLPDDTYIKKIMGYRGYKKQNNTSKDVYEEYKEIWKLPLSEAELKKQQKALDEFNAL